MSIEFRLLGDVEVHIEDKQVDIGHARQRVVLLGLLVDANRVVSVDQLVDRVWGEQPPLRARGTLSTYLTRLKHALASAQDVSITRRSSGHVLTVAPDAVDLHRFHQLIGQAHNADDDHAVVLLDQALGLWRGEAFAHLDSPWLAGIRETLNQDRFAAQLDRNERQLRRGDHVRLLPDLARQAGNHPLDERLVGQLMLALYRAGRQADALKAFHDTTRRLSEELGIDPGPELRELHTRILRGTTDLTTRPVERPATPVGRNDLPGDVVDFTGREQELQRLLAILPDHHHDTAARAVVIEAIDGMAGVGKTTLALHAAHQLVQRYPDAQLFIDLHGHTSHQQALDPMTALDMLLRALDVPGERIPHTLDARAALWRAELATRKALVVLDNAFDITQIRPLLPGSPRCLTLITSRHQLLGLDGAHILSLDVLSRAEAIALFTRILGDDPRVIAEPDAVHEVMQLCGDLPLAIRVAAARLRTRPTWTISHLAQRLRDRHRGLAELAVGDRSVAAAFALSYQHLTTDQQRLFRLLGLHPGPDFDSYAAASLSNIPLDTAENLLEVLLDAHLLQQPQRGRYRFHDLLRHHAHHTACDTDTATDRHDALHRLVHCYLHTAHAADQQLYPEHVQIPLEEPTVGCHLRSLNDPATALTWLDAEHPNLLASQHLAVEQAWYNLVLQLVWTLDTYRFRRGCIHDNLAAWQIGLAAIQPADDPALQILAHRRFGDVLARAGLHDQAFQHLYQALALAEQADDQFNQATTHAFLAVAWERRDHLPQALEHGTQALNLFENLDDAPVKIDALNLVGWYHAQLGHHTQGRTYCEASIALARRHHDRNREASALDSLGYIAQHTGHSAEAIDHYQQALLLFGDTGDVYSPADCWDRLGQVHHGLGDAGQAREAWTQALTLYQSQHRSADIERIQQHLTALDQHSVTG